MGFVISDEFLPAILTGHPMTDDEFAAFCADYPAFCFEQTAEGDLMVAPPAYTLMGVRNSSIGA